MSRLAARCFVQHHAHKWRSSARLADNRESLVPPRRTPPHERPPFAFIGPRPFASRFALRASLRWQGESTHTHTRVSPRIRERSQMTAGDGDLVVPADYCAASRRATIWGSPVNSHALARTQHQTRRTQTWTGNTVGDSHWLYRPSGWRECFKSQSKTCRRRSHGIRVILLFVQNVLRSSATSSTCTRSI